MAAIATCPHCVAQLALPETATATDRAACPECSGEFSLSETVQITLPTARIFDPVEATVASPADGAEAVGPIPTTGVAGKPSTPIINGPEGDLPSESPLAGWDQRLMNAMGTDGVDTIEQSDGTDAEEAKPQSVSEPEFDFELDEPPKVPVSERAQTETVEFDVTNALLEANGVNSALTDTTSPIVFPRDTAQSAVMKDSAGKASTIKVATVPRRIRRSLLPKVAAAVLFGPILGSLLGCYGLLWIVGPQADFLNLAQVLPTSLLPISPDMASKEDMPVEIADQTPPATASDAARASITQQHASHESAEDSAPATIHVDEQVEMAAASQTVPPPPSPLPSTSISAERFLQLSVEARAALPDLLDGELTDRAKIARKGKAYMALCRLAEHFDFSKQLSLAPAVQKEIVAAKELFLSTTTDIASRSDLSYIASRWWSHEERPNSGIFLIGRIRDAQAIGPRMEYSVEMSDQQVVTTIRVLVEEELFRIGQEVAFVGRILNDPGVLVPELATDPGKIVLAHYGFSLR